VAADGVESIIARKAGLRTNKKLNLVDSGFQYEMANLELENPNKIELYFGNEKAKRGYIWIFPKGKDIAMSVLALLLAARKLRKSILIVS